MSCHFLDLSATMICLTFPQVPDNTITCRKLAMQQACFTIDACLSMLSTDGGLWKASAAGAWIWSFIRPLSQNHPISGTARLQGDGRGQQLNNCCTLTMAHFWLILRWKRQRLCPVACLDMRHMHCFWRLIAKAHGTVLLLE